MWAVAALLWAGLSPVGYTLLEDRGEQRRKMYAIAASMNELARAQTNSVASIPTETLAGYGSRLHELAEIESQRYARFEVVMWLSSAVIVVTAVFGLYALNTAVKK
jgi:hypothetical protein